MRRMALLIAVTAVTMSVMLYTLGEQWVYLAALSVFILALLSIAFKDKFDNSRTVAAVLLVIAAFGVYLTVFEALAVDKTKALAGKSGTVTCYVREEPEHKDGYVVIPVRTSQKPKENSNLCGKVKLTLYVNTDDAIADARVGDIITADVTFYELKENNKRDNYAEKVFVSVRYSSAEITGHKYTLYESAVGIRQTVRRVINQKFSGNERGILNGIVLGDNSAMSPELYSAFKICGVLHVTAVSGLHISVLCSAITFILELFMRRSRAALVAIIPTVLVVAVTGFHPSAIRAGIMCISAFLGAAFLKQSDGLNSLGISVVIMLLINPFYVCDLGFALSCTATAGVMVASKIYVEYVSPKIKFRKRLVRIVAEAAVMTFVQSVGAVVFTMPLQVLEFGFVSVIAPVSSVAIFQAVAYSLIFAVFGIIVNLLPFIGAVSNIIFIIPKLLMKYIEVVIMFLSRLPFSYIPFGTNWAILWIGISLGLIGVWYLVGMTGGKRLISLLVMCLLVVSLWSARFTTRGVVEISCINLEKGYCTVIYSGEKCVIIGCGASDSDVYHIRSELSLHGTATVDAVVLPSESESVVGGADTLCSLLSLSKPKMIKTSGLVYETLENVSVTAHSTENGCYFEVSVYGKTVVIGFGDYTCEIQADALFSGRALPDVLSSDITVVSGDGIALATDPKYGRVFYSSEGDVSLKFIKGLDIAVYGR